ncbi:Ecm11p [Saccharomyces cerevisiae FostersB]|nr:Ecm11p [Saccharomyces cerevisiae FostersB]
MLLSLSGPFFSKLVSAAETLYVLFLYLVYHYRPQCFLFFLLSEGLTIREGFNKKAERSCLSVLLIFFSGALAASLCLFGPERLFILEGGLLFCFFLWASSLLKDSFDGGEYNVTSVVGSVFITVI